MNQLIKTICLVLITLAILVAVGFYAWDIWERQKYFERQEGLPLSPSEWREKTLEEIWKR